MSEGWARVRNVYQCCEFTVIFWGRNARGGGGGVLLILYMHICKVGGATGPQNAWGILRVK